MVKAWPLLIAEARFKVTVAPLTTTLVTLIFAEAWEIVKAAVGGGLLTSRLVSKVMVIELVLVSTAIDL